MTSCCKCPCFYAHPYGTIGCISATASAVSLGTATDHTLRQASQHSPLNTLFDDVDAPPVRLPNAQKSRATPDERRYMNMSAERYLPSILPSTAPSTTSSTPSRRNSDRDAENREIGSGQQNSRDRAEGGLPNKGGGLPSISAVFLFRILGFWITKGAGSGDFIESSLGLLLVLPPIQSKALKEIDEPLLKRFKGLEVPLRGRVLTSLQNQSLVVPPLTSML